MKIRLAAAAGTVAAAAVGTLGTDPQSSWYRALRKPRWQPPALVFPIAWTALYTLIGFGAGQALDAETDPQRRRALALVFAADLAANAGWCWMFFTARKTGPAIGVIGVLDLLNVELVRRAWRADRSAGLALLPYTGWTAFATALNADIWRRNRT
ncbi:MAG: TspO/MBR family protein [Nakamurella sp.]